MYDALRLLYKRAFLCVHTCTRRMPRSAHKRPRCLSAHSSRLRLCLPASRYVSSPRYARHSPAIIRTLPSAVLRSCTHRAHRRAFAAYTRLRVARDALISAPFHHATSSLTAHRLTVTHATAHRLHARCYRTLDLHARPRLRTQHSGARYHSGRSANRQMAWQTSALKIVILKAWRDGE